ncbi:MAG: DUF1573 domain-containing protein [Bacteroidia bacterium]|nr:DUF1573 domain-containing protein [Bacteroidia bacterium]
MSKSLQFREESFDFGQVPEEGGPVTHEFTFTNNTARPVKILTVKASCGCTTPDWSKDPIMPGKTGFVQARYNPQGRPGYFNKSLTVTTDMDTNPITLQIKGQVSASTASKNATEFQAAVGNWRLRTASFNMGRTFIKDEFTEKKFQVWNGGEKPIIYSGKTEAPDYIRVETDPKVLAPGAVGIIKISYNAKMKNAYGFQSDNITVHTDDVASPVKSFTVYATLEDYFPPLSAEEMAKAPHLTLENSNSIWGASSKMLSARKK